MSVQEKRYLFIKYPIDIPGQVEIHNGDMFLNLDGKIVTLGEIVYIENEYSPSDSNEWKKRILELADNGEVSGIARGFVQVRRSWDAELGGSDPYEIAKHRERATDLIDSVSDFYKSDLYGGIIGLSAKASIVYNGSSLANSIGETVKQEKLPSALQLQSKCDDIDTAKQHLKDIGCEKIEIYGGLIFAIYYI